MIDLLFIIVNCLRLHDVLSCVSIHTHWCYSNVVRVCARMYACICTCLHVCMSACVCLCVCVCVCVFVYVCAWGHVCTHMHSVCVCTYVCMVTYGIYVHVYVCMRVYVYIQDSTDIIKLPYCLGSSYCWAQIFLCSTGLGVRVDSDSLLYRLRSLVG